MVQSRQKLFCPLCNTKIKTIPVYQVVQLETNYQLHLSVFMLLSFTFPFLCCTNQAWTCIICIEREQPDKHVFFKNVCAVDVNVFIQI